MIAARYICDDASRDEVIAMLQDMRFDKGGYKIVITRPRDLRTAEQSAKFHAVVGDIVRAGMTWGGRARTDAEWKVLLISGHTVATGQRVEVIAGLEGELVNVRESTAQMSRERLSSLIEYAVAWATTHGVATR